jgi:hypothetical protein
MDCTFKVQQIFTLARTLNEERVFPGNATCVRFVYFLRPDSDPDFGFVGKKKKFGRRWGRVLPRPVHVDRRRGAELNRSSGRRLSGNFGTGNRGVSLIHNSVDKTVILVEGKKEKMLVYNFTRKVQKTKLKLVVFILSNYLLVINNSYIWIYLKMQ